MIKVSVVVPVWNALDCIDQAVSSVLTQSMPAEELELICVDDGSTDGSLDRLRSLEQQHERVRVISIPPSGWAGKPRNVGTDAARGEYVMYLDQDDRLEPEALERMHSLGSRNDADVILGKVTSDFRGVHQYLYREQRERCTIRTARLINSQTPHKMLRRAFLVEHDIRYPEGRRRLEDQLFMTTAYFLAASCSIVADYVCYRYLERPTGDNTSRQAVDTWAYFDYLRDVLDVVDAHTTPGPDRDHFYRRFLRVEMLNKLAGGHVLRTPLEHGDRWLLPVRRLAEERFPTSVDDGLPVTARYRAHLMRHGTFAELQALVAGTRVVQPSVGAEVSDLGSGVIRLSLRGTFLADGVPLQLEAGPDGSWLLPTSVTGPTASPDLRRVDSPADMAADLVVIHRNTGDEWFVDRPLVVSIEASGERAQLRITGTVTLDPRTVAGGRQLPAGRHDLSIRVDALGLNRLRPVHGVGASGPRVHAVSAGGPGTILQATRNGKLHLRVRAPAKVLREAASPRRLTWSRGTLTLTLPTPWSPTSGLRAELVSRRGHRRTMPLVPVPGSKVEWRSAPGRARPRPRRARVELPGVGWLAEEAVQVPVGRFSSLRRAVHRVRRAWREFRRRR